MHGNTHPIFFTHAGVALNYHRNIWFRYFLINKHMLTASSPRWLDCAIPNGLPLPKLFKLVESTVINLVFYIKLWRNLTSNYNISKLKQLSKWRNCFCWAPTVPLQPRARVAISLKALIHPFAIFLFIIFCNSPISVSSLIS